MMFYHAHTMKTKLGQLQRPSLDSHEHCFVTSMRRELEVEGKQQTKLLTTEPQTKTI